MEALHPVDRCADAHPKWGGGLMPRQAAFAPPAQEGPSNRGDPSMPASFPANMLNQKPADLGILNRLRLEPSRSEDSFSYSAALHPRTTSAAEQFFAVETPVSSRSSGGRAMHATARYGGTSVNTPRYLEESSRHLTLEFMLALKPLGADAAQI